MFGVRKENLYAQPRDGLNINHSPVVYVNLPSTQVANSIMSRSILIKEILDVFSEATNYADLLKNTDSAKLNPVLENGKSFRFNIEGIGRKINTKE